MRCRIKLVDGTEVDSEVSSLTWSDWEQVKTVCNSLRSKGNSSAAQAMHRLSHFSVPIQQNKFLTYCMDLSEDGRLPTELRDLMTPSQFALMPGPSPKKPRTAATQCLECIKYQERIAQQRSCTAPEREEAGWAM